MSRLTPHTPVLSRLALLSLLVGTSTTALAQPSAPASRPTLDQLKSEADANPNDAAAHAKLAAAYLDQNDLSAARGSADRALALDPKNVLALSVRAQCKLAAEDAGGARADFEQCLQLDPRHAGSHLGLGQIARRAKDVAAAKRHFEAALDLDPQSFPAAFYLGNLYAAEKNEAAAVSYFERTLQINPRITPARQNLAQLLQNLDRHEQALEQFSILLKDDPDNWRFLAKLVQLNTALNRPADADKARNTLRELAAAGRVENAKQFCCEQFNVGEIRVLAFETFKPIPPENVRYSFHLVRPTDTGRSDRLDYGSSDRTTQISREMKDIGPDQRIYNLDGYPATGGHVTWYLEPKDLSYAELRSKVIAIAEKKASALSSSNTPLPQATQPAR